MLLSEMFGVERNADFGVKGYESFRFNISTTPKGVDRLYFKHNDGCWIFAKSEMLTDIIYGAPDNIIHLPPPLTNEQKEQLKAIWTLGGRYLAKGKNNKMLAYDIHPVRNDNGYWLNCSNIFGVPSHLAICGLVSSDSTIPYDIGKALGVKE